MVSELTNHIWQSTAFAIAVGLVTIGFRKNRARVCKSYVESPLPCVAGVTGSNLTKRLHAILTERVICELNPAKKSALAVAAITALAVPIGIGIIGASRIPAQSQLAVPRFASASIKSCEAFSRNTVQQDLSTGSLHSQCTTLERLIQQAYGLFADAHMNRLSSVTVTGGPAWTRSDFYQIDAQAEGPLSRVTMNGRMLQTLLEDRFKLKIHRESREIPVYRLTVAEGGSKLQPFQGSCVPWDWDHPPAHPESPNVQCGASRAASNGIEMKAVTMTDICLFFLVTLDRPVVDETGMMGRVNLHLEMPAEDFRRQPRGVLALSNPAVPTTDPSLVSAVKTAARKVGLNLMPAEGPGEFLIIDEVERPLTN